MKTRTGFVSNSSSSSFCMIGAIINTGKITNPEFLNTDDDTHFCLQELLDDRVRDNGYNLYLEMIEDSLFIGYTYNEMKKDETKFEFETRLTEEINHFLKKELLVKDNVKIEDVGLQIETTYD